MGSPTTEAGRSTDETQHQVTCQRFYLGKYEVTQAQYETVMTGNSEGLNAKPGSWQNNPNYPLTVSWNDAGVSVRLNDMERPRVGYQPVGNMSCPRKPSGNMPAGRHDHGLLVK